MRFVALCLLAALASAETGVERLYRLDLLPRFHESVSVASISSYDRTGGNDDGFSGKYSFVRKEDGGLVLADLEGPGVIYRIWTPTPTDDITEFYFDGEPEPRIRLPFRQLFTGQTEPFLPPLSGLGAGGFYTYVPIPFARSCKIVVRAEKFRFYQINIATYPEAAGIRTYPGPDDPDYSSELARARAVWSSTGEDTLRHLVPPNASSESTSTQTQLHPGRPAVIFETEEPGRILGLRLSPASAFAGKSRGIILRAYWDSATTPAIEVPAGDLFGYAWGEPAVQSLLLGTHDDANYLYLPMPFDRNARIELLNEDPSAPPVEIRAEIVHAAVPRRPDEGRLHALWRRENPTQTGRPFTFVEAGGRGHIVGLILQAQGLQSGSTSFFEGDDQTTIDGKLAIHGTGSEDLFNGGWYNLPGRWNGRVSLPVSGSLDYSMALARTGGYRLFLGDAYAYRQSILQTIEHAPTENKLLTDHAAVTLLYADSPSYDATLPPLPARRVADLDRIVFTPGWSLPVESFSIHNATLTKRTLKLGEDNVRYLAIETEGEDRFGPHHIALRCDLPTAGRYRVSLEALHDPESGVIQLSRHEQPIGTPVNLTATDVSLPGPREFGVFDFQRGANTLFFRLTGGTQFNLIRIAFAAVPETVDIGSRRELFVDRHLIAELRGDASLRLHQPRPEEVVLVTDKPWEGNTSAYYTVFQDGDRYRMYYRGSHYDEQTREPSHREVTCYAESKDGITWTKPNLGLHEFDGSTSNNIVIDGIGTHNFTPFRDTNPDCRPEARYKALGRGLGEQRKSLYAFQSPDGIHWQPLGDGPVIREGAFDSQNLAFWDPTRGRYLEFHRQFRDRLREIMTTTSTDFLHWDDPVFLDFPGAPREHLYTNAILPYSRAPHILIGFPTRFHPDRGDQVEPLLMSSRDGRTFHRWADPVIPVTAPRDRDGNRSNYMAWGILDLPRDPKHLSVYASEAYYTGPDSRLRRFTYRTDGFVSLHAEAGGELLTEPLRFTGSRLTVNAAVHGGQTLRVELQDPSGSAINGFSLADCIPIRTDSLAHQVRWKHAPSLETLAGKPVRLLFRLSAGDLYSFQFGR